MPIVNGTRVPWNVSITNASQGFTALTKMVSWNLPWFWSFIMIMFYISLYIIFRPIPGRKKFIFMTLIPMVIAWIGFISYGLLPSTIGDLTTAVFLLTTFFVFLTGG